MIYPFLSATPLSILDRNDVSPSFDKNSLNKDTLVILIELPEGEDGPKGTEWIRWYIDAKTFYPIAKEVYLVHDKEVQYEFLKIVSYDFNKKIYSKQLRNKKFPEDYEKYFVEPYIKPEALAVDTVAPNWAGESFTGDSIEFKKLDAKLYMVDFWYRSCYPCVQAMPFLDSMNKKYGDRGLKVIGLNPYDYKQKNSRSFKDFLKRRDVSYTLVYVNKSVTENYKVKSFPTLYFINSEGKVVYSKIGYGKHLDDELEKFISDYLNN